MAMIVFTCGLLLLLLNVDEEELTGEGERDVGVERGKWLLSGLDETGWLVPPPPPPPLHNPIFLRMKTSS